MADDVSVVDNQRLHRYEVLVGGTRAGMSLYHRTDDTITFTHTEVDDAFEGHGLGGKLAKFALDDARVQGLRVVARCPFIAAYIDRHPEYQDLLAR